MTILQDAHARVEVASDGAIALSMLKEAPAGYYDVILMDIQMPHMNGYQASEAIRKLLDDRARTPIIVMTANAFEEDHKAAGSRNGCLCGETDRDRHSVFHNHAGTE